MLDALADLSPARVVQGLSRPAQDLVSVYISCSIDIFLRPALLTKLKIVFNA